MANSQQLRNNINQHKAKNTLSKYDDKLVYIAMEETISYLKGRFSKFLEGFELVFEKSISFEFMMDSIRESHVRKDFELFFKKRTIKPDGGAILLKHKDGHKSVIVISEVKRQGTNDQRIEEGKKKQAQGNAIERLGKNLTGIRAMLNHEDITPFVCFGSGCDFVEKYDEDSFVMSKISMLNQFYPLNKIYVHKQDGNSEKNSFAPVSMFFKEEVWTKEEMFNVLKEVAETSLRYYIF